MATTNYLWDPLTDSVVHEADGSNVTQATYTSEPAAFGPLVSQRRGGSSSYYHYDALGSTRQLTNAAQTVTDSYTPSAWGEEIAASGSTTNPYRWVGRLGYGWSSTLGEFYVRARWYLAITSRWLSVDPIGFAGGDANLFRYVANSPVGGTYRFTSREWDVESKLHYFRARYYDDAGGRFTNRGPLDYLDGTNLYAGYFIPSRTDPSGLGFYGCEGVRLLYFICTFEYNDCIRRGFPELLCDAARYGCFHAADLAMDACKLGEISLNCRVWIIFDWQTWRPCDPRLDPNCTDWGT